MENSGINPASTAQGVGNSVESSSRVDAIVQNMAIAHELAVDGDFKLNEVPTYSLEGQVKKIVHQAFWNVLQEDISKDPPNYQQAIKLLAEIKEILLSLTFEYNNTLREKINSILDIDLIKQQSEHDIVDIQGYANFIVQTMSKICVPARDEDIEKLTTIEGGLVVLFREIFRILDLMKLDMANYRLSVLRPQIRQQSVEYERKKFAEYLSANPNGLLSSIHWMKRGLDIVREEMESSEVDGVHSEASVDNDGSQAPTRPELVQICKHCYIAILLGEGDFPFPETLLMDSHRMTEMRLTCLYLIKLSSVITVTLSIVGRHLGSDAEYKRTIKESTGLILKGRKESDIPLAFPNICEQLIEETDSFLSKRGLTCLDEEKSSLMRQQIINLSDEKNTICQLVNRPCLCVHGPDGKITKEIRGLIIVLPNNERFQNAKFTMKKGKRMYNFLLGNLLGPVTSKDTRMTVPTALADIEIELLNLINKLGPIVAHNYAVFQPFYEDILTNLPS